MIKVGVEGVGEAWVDMPVGVLGDVTGRVAVEDVCSLTGPGPPKTCLAARPRSS